ncbi:MAG: LssY C-terminal domain-containing protein [Candidatus Scalindua rubra]|uniref:LssY-like C-terminal domain-containing protein n=1 Tax=Candidatus Scalindua brodae TaxID=237368 RepID=A0A0B0EIC3_9BACT|nr:MAG: hypothetical protein SCABRO_03830 [Candidatus Scalindua brodae]MBZ0109601.1 LssY C-terminal domain-containing protein [Candidatus Scalindua rubra]TWU33145.1 hypothetical protein S225a_15970 [Candidatus Brocadiaceae bacterium S225]
MTMKSLQIKIVIQSLMTVMMIVLVSACGTYNPIPIDEVNFHQRSQTKSVGKLTVTASVLSPKESKLIFGRPLAKKGVQPVWLEIVNNEDIPFAIIVMATDPKYFSSAEVAHINRVSNKDKNKQMEEDYRKLDIDMIINPGETKSGFVHTNLGLGIKVVPVVLYGPKQVRTLVFYIPVPGIKADHTRVNFEDLYQPEEFIKYDKEEDFRAKLSDFQCCARNEKDTKDGDPLNLVLVGRPDVIYGALARAGWDETEAVTFSTGLKMAKAFLKGDMYLNAPISPQYVFGRPQDIALQKGRDSVNERNHMRLWLTPWVFRDMSVWIGQISRDIGIRMTTGVWSLTTHAVDPEVDDARDYLITDVMSVQGLAKLGMVKGVGAATPQKPREIILGDPYWTDGRRAVMLFSEEPVAMDKIEFLIWDLRVKGAKEIIERLQKESTSKSD